MKNYAIEIADSVKEWGGFPNFALGYSSEIYERDKDAINKATTAAGFVPDAWKPKDKPATHLWQGVWTYIRKSSQ